MFAYCKQSAGGNGLGMRLVSSKLAGKKSASSVTLRWSSEMFLSTKTVWTTLCTLHYKFVWIISNRLLLSDKKKLPKKQKSMYWVLMLIISKTLQETMTANVVGKVLSYCFTVCSNIALRHLQIAGRNSETTNLSRYKRLLDQQARLHPSQKQSNILKCSTSKFCLCRWLG